MASPQKEEGYVPIANELVEQFAKINLSPYEWRTLWVLWRKTWGWQKKRDKISISQFQKLTGLDRRHQHRTLLSLERKKFIARKGNSYVTTYMFQKDYSKWKTVANKGTSASRGNTLLPVEATNLLPVEAPTKDNKETIQKTEEIFDYFRIQTNQPRIILHNSRRDLIRKRLNDGFTVDQMKNAITNFSQDTWEGRKDHMDIIYCLGQQKGKADNLEKWLNKDSENQWRNPC